MVGGRRTDTGRLGAFITRVKVGSVADTIGRLKAGTVVDIIWTGTLFRRRSVGVEWYNTDERDLRPSLRDHIQE